MRNYNELIRRCLWAFILILIMQLGRNIYLPGFVYESNNIDGSLLDQFLSSVTGGNFTRPSIFTLGIGPYMTGLIIWTMVSMIDIDAINNLSQRKRSAIQKSIMFVFAIAQGIAVMLRFRTMIDEGFFPGLSNFQIIAMNVFLLSAGAMFVSWLADQNCEKGIGAQMVFIIPGLIGNLPRMLVTGQTQEVSVNAGMITGLIVITLIFIFMTLFLYKSEVRIRIERTGIDSEFNNSYIPIRLLTGGAMPFMFAITIFSIPPLFLLIKSIDNTIFSYFLTTYFTFTTIQGILMYGVIVFGLGIGFSFMNVRPHDIAKNLKKSGDYIFGIPPGDRTEEYIKKKLYRICFVGNCYMVLVSWIPLFIGLKVPLVTNLAFYFGSLLMLVVILDTLVQEVKFIYSKSQYDLF
ncbi:accessory Sec system protein translocase subunit SecY2 [Enterococcus sp. ALS3]|uniref:Accessory Sec system protein translocase subunit SecY2 n=1 Tax=Enterococcus alishanensis TaxID=1303817 RepID=A0ABS6TDY3_9ENTE|nr:accessory Sec system protein translocase subunit SecY2 [Enterococcus alishanensis]MBV7391116.1 accessory Sec system protein translocase subunit SecY2 [Enterococcus alishanensis]